MSDLFSPLARAKGCSARAIRPEREIGAYEALWAEEGASFRSLAQKFRAAPDSLPSDLVPPRVAGQYAQWALGALRGAGIERFGIRVHGAGEYPLALHDAEHPVEFLYYQGNWNLTRSRSVAIVGTRHPSDDGFKRAAKLARSFVQSDFTVVSGLAKGIDSAAHSAALEERGRTIAVLGTPITACYPPENATLQKRIADDHLLISQVPIIRYSRQTWEGNRVFFPERNMTMSALTEATVIVEAGDTSGALIQGRHALRQGRKLFILDSCFRDSTLRWPAKLLERGAIRVRRFEDIRGRLAP